MLLQRRPDRLQAHAALGVLRDLEHVHVLDREVVVAELEVAAHALEVRRLERRHERLLVGDVALDLADRGVEQQRGVVRLRRVLRRDAVVLLLEVVDELAGSPGC